jgi:hypothetical protein
VKEGGAAVADDVEHVRVTEDEVAAAQLEIRLLQRLGRRVDARLEAIANAKPAKPEAGGEGSTTEHLNAIMRAFQESTRGALEKALEGRDRSSILPSVRRHVRDRHQGNTSSDVMIGSWSAGIPLLLDVKGAVAAASDPRRAALGMVALPFPSSAEKLRTFHVLQIVEDQVAKETLLDLSSVNRDDLKL